MNASWDATHFRRWAADQGIPPPKDSRETGRWLRLAAEQGYALPQYVVGVSCRERGDFAGAMKWFTVAARQGCLAAQHELGLIYYQGKDVSEDTAQAARWFRAAALCPVNRSIIRGVPGATLSLTKSQAYQERGDCRGTGTGSCQSRSSGCLPAYGLRQVQSAIRTSHLPAKYPTS